MRRLFVTFFAVILHAYSLFAQDRYWTQPELPSNFSANTDIQVSKYELFSLDTTLLLQVLNAAPPEASPKDGSNPTILKIPDPEGGTKEFQIVSYQMMEEGLSSRYPNIKTLKGVNLANPRETIRLDWTSFGFHAYIRSSEGSYYIDPFNRNIKDLYLVYRKADVQGQPFECHVDDSDKILIDTEEFRPRAFGKAFGDCTFRTYRLAQATTGEYSNFHGATNASQSGLVLSAVTTVINRVNEVYERDMTVRLILIANTDQIFYYNPNTDPYTNNNGGAMLGQNQTTCDNVIGSANYDIGHVFSTGGGGVANLRAPCNNNLKARGVTGLPNPVGDPFSIDYVAHEMGHQFGANHTQNNNCNRVAATAMEPGSASTIMGYAGICNPNVQNSSDDYMHAVSLNEIANFVTGLGNSCATPLSFTNSAPFVDGGGNHSIPISTPFVLTANATDADGDPLTYCWEQYDNQIGFPMPPSPTSTGGPMFRSRNPTSSPERYFPNLPAIVSGNSPTWEVIPSVGRNMNFRVTVRDNNEVASCLDNDLITVTTVAEAGPFTVIQPNTFMTLQQGQFFRVEWDAANTNMPPVSCAQVDIFLSTNGGQSFDLVLAESVDNNGYAFVQMPMISSTQCRVMIKCSSSIFLDVSDQNFTITTGSSAPSLGAFPAFQSVCVPSEINLTISVASTGGFNGPVTLSLLNPPSGAVATFSVNPILPGQSTQLTLTGLENGGLGLQNFSIQGQYASGTTTMPLTFTLNAGGASTSLQTPFNGSIEVSPIPSLAFSTTGGTLFHEVQLSTNPDFANVLGTFQVTGSPFIPTFSLQPGTTYYWRVRPVAGCGPGVYTEGWSFTTSSCEFYTSTNIPITIPSASPVTVTSVLNIPDNGIVQDVNVVDLNGTHTWINDLIVRLISPSGTVVTLFDRICNNEDDFFVSFDDQASLVTLPCPPTSGLAYRPASPLAAFNGESMQGNWTLQIQDMAAQDGGQLLGWSLEICAEGLTYLPVEWISFEVKASDVGNDALLDWIVTFEEESEYFEIERSVGNATDFRVIAWIPDDRENADEQYFQYLDKNIPINLPVYYRVKQIDRDGAFSYSPIRLVTIADETRLSLHPNPVGNRLYVSNNSSALLRQEAVYMVRDLSGRIVSSGVLNDMTTEIETTEWIPGLYLMEVQDGQNLHVFKIVK